jgi:hypothetical protein
MANQFPVSVNQPYGSRASKVQMTVHHMQNYDYTSAPRLQKLKHSNFNITLNTNYRPKREEIERFDKLYTEAIEEALNKNDCHAIFDALRVIDSIQDDPNHPGKRVYTTHKMTMQEYDTLVKNIQTEYKCEVGVNFKYGGRFHIHGFIYILHTSRLHLDMDPIVNAINTECNKRGIPTIKYAHASYEKPSMRDYMKKMDFV